MNEQTFSLEDEIIDLEWCAKHGHTPPSGRKYRIKVNNHVYVVKEECLTGREILKVAGKEPPERWTLFQVVRGKKEPVKLDETVCFTKPGIEKFIAIPSDVRMEKIGGISPDARQGTP
jgi:hypothetical protein